MNTDPKISLYMIVESARKWNEDSVQFRVPGVHWLVVSENKPSTGVEGYTGFAGGY
jgi:hypothetical protein